MTAESIVLMRFLGRERIEVEKDGKPVPGRAAMALRGCVVPPDADGPWWRKTHQETTMQRRDINAPNAPAPAGAHSRNFANQPSVQVGPVRLVLTSSA